MAGGGNATGSRVKYDYHIGEWGNPYQGGGQPGRGVTSFSLSPNRQRPMANVVSKGFWNMIRRSKNQVLYVVPPFILAYSAMHWAIERNEYLNSKPGRAEFADAEE